MKIENIEKLVTEVDHFVNREGRVFRATPDVPDSWCVKSLDTSAFLEILEAARPKGQEVFSDAGYKFFREFCEQNGVEYYAAPREDFSIYVAFDRANKSRRQYLVCEDLS